MRPQNPPQSPQSPHETPGNPETQEPVLTGQQRRKIKHQEVFLDKYAESGEICAAAEAADIDRGCHYDWMASDEGYVQRFQDLEQTRVQRANDTAYRLGVVGVMVPKTVAGVRVDVREHDSKALIRWLETHDPKWRQQKIVELKVEDWDGDIDRLTPEGQEKLLERINARIAAQAGQSVIEAAAEGARKSAVISAQQWRRCSAASPDP